MRGVRSVNRPEVLDRIQELISRALEIPKDDVTEASRFVDDFDADSLDLLELVIALQDEFGITVSDGEIKAMLVELARFLPGDSTISEDSSDEEFVEVTRRLTVGAIVDFVADRLTAAV
ncbi:MAG: phosphopantetheine-binding protein [Acidimicrobiales bacterium]